MKISEIRRHFPVFKNRCYLFTGGVVPASYESRAAMERFMDELSHNPAGVFKRMGEEPALVRQRFAQIISADEDEIALTDCTGTGSNLAVGMIEPLPGSNVAFDEMAYPSSCISLDAASPFSC